MRSVRPPPRVVPPKHLFEPAYEDSYAPPYSQQQPPPLEQYARPQTFNNESDFDRDVKEQMKILENNIRGMIEDNPKSFDAFNNSRNNNNDLFAKMAQEQREESLQPQLFMYSSQAQPSSSHSNNKSNFTEPRGHTPGDRRGNLMYGGQDRDESELQTDICIVFLMLPICREYSS